MEPMKPLSKRTPQHLSPLSRLSAKQRIAFLPSTQPGLDPHPTSSSGAQSGSRRPPEPCLNLLQSHSSPQSLWPSTHPRAPENCTGLEQNYFQGPPERMGVPSFLTLAVRQGGSGGTGGDRWGVASERWALGGAGGVALSTFCCQHGPGICPNPSPGTDQLLLPRTPCTHPAAHTVSP